MIAKNLFANNADFARYVGLSVTHSRTGAIGRIDSLFGQTGKFKVVFKDGVGEETGEASDEPARLVLEFKQYVGDAAESAAAAAAAAPATKSKAAQATKGKAAATANRTLKQ